MKFYVIGDVYGEFDKLVALLSKLGYSNSGGYWRHSSRRAVFVGDCRRPQFPSNPSGLGQTVQISQMRVSS